MTKINCENIKPQEYQIKKVNKTSNNLFDEKLTKAEKNSEKKANGTDIAYKIAKEFEVNSYSILWNMAFRTVPISEVTGGGKGEEMFRDFLVNALVKEAYEDKNTSLFDNVYKKLTENDERDK